MANGHGGPRPNSGNKTKQDFEKTNHIFITAIKQLKSVDTDDDARIELAKELMTFDRGKIFISEHIFGKPKERVESDVTINTTTLKDLINFGNAES